MSTSLEQPASDEIMQRRAIEAAIFVGPSLRKSDLNELAEGIEVLPPAAQGDIYRLAQFEPRYIGLVDGYFHSVPAPWHKEILWALSKGIVVLGAGSLGALRAAELSQFGMQGIGAVYEMFASGELNDDDEVAITHGPAELAYIPVSEAMVNLRFTLKHAVTAGQLSSVDHDRLIALAKARPFWRRSLQGLFADAKQAELAIPVAQQQWIKDNVINQKRIDARFLLKALANYMRAPGVHDSSHLRQSFRFEVTTMWQSVCEEHVALEDTTEVGLRELILEIALKGQSFAKSAKVYPINVPVPDPLAQTYGKENSCAQQEHHKWLQDFVRTLRASGHYRDLLEAALRRRRARASFGAPPTFKDAERAVAQHFDEIDDLLPWFTARTPSCWSGGKEFWSKFDSYARSLGLSSSDELIRAVVANHLQNT